MPYKKRPVPNFVTFFAGIAIGSWSLMPSLSALYNGNPSFPMMPEEALFFPKDSGITLKAGYEWDDVFNQRLTLKKNQDYLNRKVRQYHTTSQFGTVTLGFNDRVEFYGAMGAMTARSQFHPYSSGTIKYHTDSSFAWDIGGRAILAYWGDTQLGVDAKHIQFNPTIKSMTLQHHSLHPHKVSYQYRQWQIGLGASHRFGLVVPYLGVNYSHVHLKFHNLKTLGGVFPDSHVTMKNRFPFGLFMGCGFSLVRALDLNAELRLIDETAVTISGDIRF